jgi:HSP20 family protein
VPLPGRGRGRLAARTAGCSLASSRSRASSAATEMGNRARSRSAQPGFTTAGPGPGRDTAASAPASAPAGSPGPGRLYICLDLPGIDPGSIDLTVEQNVLTVRADRTPVKADGAQMIVAERPSGTFTRQVFLGETLDADNIAADYAAGVLTLTIPVREQAKPRSIQVTSSDARQAVTA